MEKLDDDIKKALLKKAQGYTYTEEEYITDKSGKPGKVKVTKKYQPPDLAAIKIIQDYKLKGLW